MVDKQAFHLTGTGYSTSMAPQILEYLGTFRFLITELVPLQLIIQKERLAATEEV